MITLDQTIGFILYPAFDSYLWDTSGKNTSIHS